MDFSSLLSCLTRERLVEVGRALGLTLPSNARKERQIEAFLEAAPGQLAVVVGLLQRDELKVACRQHGLADGGRARFELALRLLVAAGIEDATIAPSFAAEDEYRDLPRPGDVVRVRHRQYLVETVTPPTELRRPGGPMVAHRVRLVGLDDDSQGRPLEALWEAELGAQIRQGQRNSRIDRTLQPSADVYCRYFTHRDRPEDRVLDTLVSKVQVIQQEVGSLDTVILDEIKKLLAAGIGPATAEQIDKSGAMQGRLPGARLVVQGL